MQFLRRRPNRRDCLVVGAGRSGTSMLAGLLASNGLDMGPDLHPASEWNPKGFFEDRSTTSLNERIMQPAVNEFNRTHQMNRSLQPGEAWLVHFPLEYVPTVSPEIERDIAAQAATRPLYRKDPRFCFTLPVWRPYLGRKPLFLCIFRDPLRTAASVCRFGAAHDLGMSTEQALDLWCDSYDIILQRHSRDGEWIFVHYAQVVSGDSTARIAAALGVRLEGGFAEDGMQSEPADVPMGARVAAVYEELCRRAGYT